MQKNNKKKIHKNKRGAAGNSEKGCEDLL